MTNKTIATLKISDLQQSREFYETVLSFSVDWVWGEDEASPAFAQISLHGAQLYLTERDESVIGALVYIYVEDVDSLYRQLLAKGIPVDALPHDEPWGNREMQVKDPDGNCLRFCTPISRFK